MKTAIQDLIHEHKAIQIALNILEKIRERLEKNETTDYKDINDLLEFLKEFADKCHHGKEEGYLFPLLQKAGVKNENGPIGVMLKEHTQGRNLIKQMQDSILARSVNNAEFVEAATSYVNLLRMHIEKENKILFPMVDVRLSESEQKELLEQFEDHEEKVIGSGRHEELHALLEKFSKKYLN
jgi:hemerythrin-like domain-containing protein